MRNVILISIIFLLFVQRARNSEFVPDYTFQCKAKEIVVRAKKVNWKEIELAAKLVYSEAGNQSDSGKIAVLDVIKNRLLQEYNNISEVIFEKGQFDGIRGNWIYDSLSYDIAKQSLIYNERVLDFDYLYFYNPKISTDISFVNSMRKKECIRIDDHLFCKK